MHDRHHPSTPPHPEAPPPQDAPLDATPPQSPSNPQIISPMQAHTVPEVHGSPDHSKQEHQPEPAPDPLVTSPPKVASPPRAQPPSQLPADRKREPTANASTPQVARRNQRGRSRVGRPPNINENSLMRRLECVMAVDSGRMTMLTACQQYDISARTFYRWLRNKERLIQLTGFTEEDFKNGTLQTDKEAFPDQDAHRMPPQRDVEANLPRLPNQPAVTPQDPRVAKDPAQDPAAPGPPAPVFPGAGAKRRMPKAVDHSRDYGQPGADGYATPNSAFYRRNFTKMPSQAQLARDPPPPVDRQTAARNSTRMRRETWHPPEPENVDPQYTSDDRNYPPTFIDSRSNSPQDSYKRRKVARTETPVAADEQQDTVADEPMPEQPVDAAVQEQFTNGAADHPPQPVQRPHPQPNPVSQSTRMPPNGTASKRDITGQDPVADPRGPRKHRIEIMMGRRKVTIAWYDGASAADIKAAIARRFALLPGTQWALMDRAYDEIVISDGVPSGRYTLTVFS